MQTRKVVVEIKTVDDRHCSKRCKCFEDEQFNACAYCKLFRETLGKINNRFIRTASCIKSEKGGGSQ